MHRKGLAGRPGPFDGLKENEKIYFDIQGCGSCDGFLSLDFYLL